MITSKSRLFLVLEGLDGAGTTTQTRHLAAWLRARGRSVHVTREPTAGPVGRIIRQVLQRAPDAPAEETLPWLFAADRADHLHREIEPALAAGSDVISDRYYHSSLAYQALTLPYPRVHALNADFRTPDLTLFVTVPVEVALTRIHARSAVTGEAPELYEQRDRLLAIAASYDAVLADLRARGEPIVTIDGAATEADVTAAIVAATAPLLD